MKKNSTKLQLKTKTIRVLQPGELAGVNGGAPTANCTEQMTICGGCRIRPEDCDR